MTSPDLDLSRLRALAQQAKEPCANPECGDGDEVCPICQAVRELSYAVTPDVILHLVQRLERIEAWATNSVAYSQTQDPFLRGHAGACQKVRELLELKAKP